MSIFSLFRPINAALSPNTQVDDIWCVLKLFLPWNFSKWQAGKEIGELENKFKEYFGVGNAISFSSGRAGLYAILKSINESHSNANGRNEVMIQAYTTIALPLAIKKAGLKPVYIDIGRNTFNMDPDKIEEKITFRTMAIIVQHTFGAPADMDKIAQIAKKYKLFLIEDCAHSLGAEYGGKKIGTFGDAAFFSFGRDKIISSTSGGMVIAKNEKIAEKIKEFQSIMSFPPLSRIFQQLMHPLVFWCALPIYYFLNIGKYKIFLAQKLGIISRAYSEVEKKGGNAKFIGYKFPNVLAVLALCQFKKMERFNDHRRKIAKIYENLLANCREVKIPMVFCDSKPTFLYYTIQVEKRDELLKFAAKKHMILGDWFPGALGPKGAQEEKFGYKKGDCPVAEKAGLTSLNLPTNINTGEKDARKVANLIREFLNDNKNGN